ncbi:hypothetical protein [Paenibacillus taichungensis]
MESGNYTVCWTDTNGQKKWEVVSGEDELQVFVSALEDPSPSVFPMSEELDAKTNDNRADAATQVIKTPIGSITVSRTSDPLYPGFYVSVNETGLVLVEYEPDQGKHAIRVWNQSDPENDPEYVQLIEPTVSAMDAI